MGNQSLVGDNRVNVQGSDDLWKVEKVEEDESFCEFTCTKKGVIEVERCKSAVKILRVLRHPNILKFLSSQVSSDVIVFTSELAYPLQSILSSQKLDGLVRGWRDISCGLEFLHNKVRISHNNIHIGCIYVGASDSRWKIGGFELAMEQQMCTDQFLSLVVSLRHNMAVPPEDKESSSSEKRVEQPIHSRDIWALGQLMLQSIEDIQSEDEIQDDLLYYINDEMLNPSPELRPTVAEVMEQSWMSNDITVTVDFLTNLTMKSQEEKDEFFKLLASRLHSFSSCVIAEHVIPLLVTPLVIAEPQASEHLWQHVLCPSSSSHPKSNEFDPHAINPFVTEEQFRSNVLPLLLNMLECREYHVRLVLLQYLHSFCYLCSKEDLCNVVLPEVLLGLKDSRDDLVAATLHALADLVPLVGASIVMGTDGKSIFSDTRPKIRGTLSPGDIVRKNTSFRNKVSLHTRSNHLKKEISQQDIKLEKDCVHKQSSLLSAMEDKGLPTNKYSPSVSNDDEEDLEQFESFMDESTTDWDKWGDEEEEKEEEDEEKDEELKPTKVEYQREVSLTSSTGNVNKGMKLQKGTVKQSNTQSESSTSTESSLRMSLKGKVNESDIKRLEEKAEWSKELDLFADMAPSISKTVRHVIDDSINDEQSGITNNSKQSVDLNYKPKDDEIMEDGWGYDDWNNL